MSTGTKAAVMPVPRSRVARLGEAPIQPIRATCARCGCWHALLLLSPTERGSGICPRCSWGVEHSDER